MPVSAHGQEALRWYGTHTDIEDMVEARQRAESADRAKSVFLATMSHEMRTPLNAVVGLTSLMLHHPPAPAQQQRFLATMHDSAENLGRLIGDVLDFAKIESDQLELYETDFSPYMVAEEALRIGAVKATEKNITVALDCDIPCDVHVRGDALRTKQILMNLLSNAIKFTAKGGVTLRVRAGPVLDGVMPLTFEVRDTGIGIAPEQLDRIFEEFVQADSTISGRFGGTGLGLAISRKLARAMKGDIRVESEPNRGSVFTLSLDLRVSNPAPKCRGGAADSLLDEERPGAGRILVVEDDATNAMVVTALLDAMGQVYDLAQDGREALEKFEVGAYTAVLMDVRMPRMDGLEATQNIRQIERGQAREPASIVVMTAQATAGMHEAALSAGANAFWVKPVSTEALRRLLALEQGGKPTMGGDATAE